MPSTPACLTSSSSRTRDKLGALGERLAERSPVWLKMGIAAEPAPRATMPKVGKAKRLSATDVEVEKGYSLAAARAEAMRCLQCECPSNGACDLQKLGVRVRDHGQRPRRQGQPRARRRGPARAPLHPARHGPLHRLRQVRARLPRRGGPGLLRLHGPRLHHQRRHAVRRGSAAGRLHQLRPLRHLLPHRRAHVQRARAVVVQGRREPLHHVQAVRGGLPRRRPQGDQPLRGRTPEVDGARGARAASWPAAIACAPAAAPRSWCVRC